MNFVFLASLTGGLLLAVRVMLFGVERPRMFGDLSARSFRVSPAVIAAVAVVFGATGYLLLRGGVGIPASVGVAAVLAALAAVATVRLVKKWWAVPVEHDVDDPRYVLQGHLARVVTPIEEGLEGEVAFDVGDKHRVVRARSIDDAALAAGTEVVIERLEDDLAYVEAWAQVEKRL